MNKADYGYILFIVGLIILGATLIMTLSGMSACSNGIANWRNEAILSSSVDTVRLVMAVAPYSAVIGGLLTFSGLSLVIKDMWGCRQ